MIKPNWNKFKAKFTLVDNAFGWFQNTKIGKYYLKGTSFYKILFFFGSILVAQISAYTNLTSLASKVDTQLANSEGWAYAGWFILSWFVPEGNLFLIAVLILILVGAFIIKFREPKEKNLEDILLKPLREKAKNILFEIQTSIQYNNQKIVINRDKVIENITHELKEKQIIVLSGVGGVGKTSVIKQIYEQYENKEAFYIFKASEFKNSDLLKNYSLQEFTDAHVNSDNKILVIDSAEKLFDNTDDDFFKEFLSALLQNEWKIIFTIRDNYLDILNYQFIEVYEIKPFYIHIANLTLKKLLTLSKDFKFTIPTDDKLITLIKNPFYLHKYLQYYDENQNINYKAFKDKLWDRKINNSNSYKEECFLNLAFKRANEGQFFIDDIKCKSNSLKQLKEDGILGKETAGYFITHDIYEEWALEKIIEKEFINRSSNLDFFEKIGSSLPIRRSFRNWVSEKLLLNSDDIKSFIEEIIDDNAIEPFWRDEVLVSVLLSDYSDTFFENFERELLADDYDLLKQISFLLRLACKEADDSVFGQYGLKLSSTEIFSMQNKPKGNGWKSFVQFVFNHFDTIELQAINMILPILSEWNHAFKEGKTTRMSSLIALKYYSCINENNSYKYNNNITRVCEVIISGSSEIQKELGIIFDKILENNWKSHGDNYYKLSEMILTKITGALVAKYMPEYIFKLANLFWIYTPKKLPKGVFIGYENDEVETAYGLEPYRFEYSPSSAYQTPVYFLLKSHLLKTLDFILEFVNKSVEHYVHSNWEWQEDIKEVDVYINDMVIKQYHSLALWTIYRGVSSPITPNLLQSIHMALEKSLLEIAKVSESKILEPLLIYLLKSSKSSSITAVVTSIVLAYPEKTFNVALILFRTKEFIIDDLHRAKGSENQVESLYSIGYGLNQSTTFYNDERLETCKDKHRESHLESLFLNYQMFRNKEVSKDEADNIQKKLWKILDYYYQELPSKEEQVDSDRTWRMFLARMDRRKMNIEVQKVKNGVEITFNPELDTELQEYSQKSEKETTKSLKYTSLYLWGVNRLENNLDYKKYIDFEKNPKLALEQLKEIIAIPKEEKDLYFLHSSIPADICSVLIRDFREILNEEEKVFCKEIILEVAMLPFNLNYRFSISDGIKHSISILPLLINESLEDKNNIKAILLFLLFQDNQLLPNQDSYAKYAISGIQKYLWKQYPEDAQSLLFAYLILKPKYDTPIEKIVKGTYEQRFERINKEERFENFLEENKFELEKFEQNSLSFSDIDNISNIDLYILKTAFLLLPLNITDEVHKKIAKEIIASFALQILNENRNEKIRAEIKYGFFDRLAYFILESKQEDIQMYLSPWIENLVESEAIVDLFIQFIFAQDRLKKYDNFWYVWELFENKIIKLCVDNNSYYTNQIIKIYLLAQSKYGYIWNKGVKEWHSFKPRDTRFFKRMSQKIGHCPSTLYSISKLLTGIGSSYLNDGIGWISYMLKNNKNLHTDELEPDTIFNLEIITRKYVLQNSQEIKKKKVKREELLEVLDFLVERGSAIGYMLRERIV